MDKDTENTPSGFELLLIPKDLLSQEKLDELPEIRRVWEKDSQTWYYSVLDFIRLLTDSKKPASYWSMVKKRDKHLQETLETIKTIPLRAKDGRLRDAECASRQSILRIIQSIPSQKAEPVRIWLSQIGEEKLQEIDQRTQEDQLRDYYLRSGRTLEWANARIRNLTGRNALTDEWLTRGAQQNLHFGILTKTIHEGTFGIPPSKHHHEIKSLPKSTKKPRDHYTEDELGVLTLAELAARRRHERNNSQGYVELLADAKIAGEFGERVRLEFEAASGQPVVSSQNYLEKRIERQQQPSLFDEFNTPESGR